MNDQNADPIVCYLLLRTDLESLGRGKAQAHAMHAGNHLTHVLCVKPLLAGGDIDPRVEEWCEEDGFGTTLSVGGADIVDIEVLEGVVCAAEKCGHMAGLVIDGSYPFQVSDEIHDLLDPRLQTLPARRSRDGWTCFRRETTAGWVLGRKSELGVLMARFGLTPNDR